MYFEKDKIYHIYNRSNEKLFYSRNNYIFFVKKMKKLLFPICDILSWCLMPNHFHLLIQANEKSVENINEKHRKDVVFLQKNIGVLLSSYTQAINKQENRRGKLFAHNTKAICINDSVNNNYIENCFFYIHQNPVNANLVSKLEDWEFSSFKDYAKLRNGTLINKKIASQIINYDDENFYKQSYCNIDEKIIKQIF